MKKRFILTGLLSLITTGWLMFFGIATIQAASGERINISFSCTTAPESVVDLATVEFKNMVEKRSEGRISVTLYRHGQLYDPKGEIEAVARGGVTMAALTNLGGRSLALEFIGGFGVQGCCLDVDHYWRFIDLPETRQIADREFETKVNAKLLSILPYGPGIVGNSKRPIHTVDDYKGLKMRVSGTAQAALFKALGMVPAQMSSKEVYMALQRGTIDGAPSGPERFLKAKWYEVTKYLTNDYTVPDISPWLAINLDFWNRLSSQDQLILSEAAIDLKKWARTHSIKATEESYNQLRPLVEDFYFFPKSEVEKINAIAEPIMYNLIVQTAGKEMGERLWSLLMNAKPGK